MAHFHRLLFCLLALVYGSGAHAQAAPPDSALFQFERTTHDFGAIPTDTVAQYRFEFVNRGNAMLIINDISLSCPCFSVNWSRGPVMPGGKGWVDIHYPTGEQAGSFDKVLWIASNAANSDPNTGSYELRLRGTAVDRARASGKSGQKNSRLHKRRR